jgi:hypothetical protein
VPAEHGARRKVRKYLPGDRDVGKQHELLYKRVCVERLLHLDVDGVVRLAQGGEAHLLCDGRYVRLRVDDVSLRGW